MIVTNDTLVGTERRRPRYVTVQLYYVRNVFNKYPDQNSYKKRKNTFNAVGDILLYQNELEIISLKPAIDSARSKLVVLNETAIF